MGDAGVGTVWNKGGVGVDVGDEFVQWLLGVRQSSGCRDGLGVAAGGSGEIEK